MVELRRHNEVEKKWMLSLVLAGLFLTMPSKIKPMIVHSIHTPLKIELQRTEPPRKAFDIITRKVPQALDPLEWNLLTQKTGIDLNQLLVQVRQTKMESLRGVHRVNLAPLVLQKPKTPEVELAALAKAESAAANSNGGTHVVGNLRLAEGVMAGDRSLKIKHIVDGRVQEIGDIDPKKGTFSIQVADTLGLLRAELLESDGTPVASGDFRPGDSTLTGSPEIVLAPHNQMNFKTVHYTGGKSPKSSANPTVPSQTLIAALGSKIQSDEFGDNQLTRVARDSWALARTQAQGHQQTLSMMSPLKPMDVPLFSERLMKAFLGGHRSVDQSPGILWMTVTANGKNLDDVELTIQGSDLVPNVGNGSYVFTNLEPGFYQVVAKKEGHLLGHYNAFVDTNAATVGEIEINDRFAQVPVKTFDALSGEPLTARLDLQSLEASSFSEGISEIQLPKLHRLSFGEAYPQQADYVPSRILYSDDTESLVVPLVKEAWLKERLQARAIRQQQDTGVIVGFVSEGTYKVYLPDQENYDETNVVFFDPTGAEVMGPTAGGGFILFNVPAGTQSVTVVSQSSNLMNTQIVPMDPNAVYTLNINF